MDLNETLEDLFTYHPATPEQSARYERINAAAKAFAQVVIEECAGCPDASDAIRKIREARMAANSAIATKSGGLIRW